MDLYSIIFLGGLGVTVALGFLFGFGKVFKFCTGGIVKHLIALWFCFTFGGMIASIPLVSMLIQRGNTFFGGYASILAKLNVASWIYYIILFALVELVRFLIAVLVKKVFEPKDKKTTIGGIRNIINRTLGALCFGAFWLLLVWAILAIVALLTDVAVISTWLESIAGDKAARLIYGLYRYNPIDFSVLFGWN